MNEYYSRRKIFLIFGISINIILLAIFKYLDFMMLNINYLFSLKISVPGIKLPIGISFFTFQAISYLVDIYFRHTKAQRSLIIFGTYLIMFPQLVAGPIIRYLSINAGKLILLTVFYWNPSVFLLKIL